MIAHRAPPGCTGIGSRQASAPLRERGGARAVARTEIGGATTAADEAEAAGPPPGGARAASFYAHPSLLDTDRLVDTGAGPTRRAARSRLRQRGQWALRGLRRPGAGSGQHGPRHGLSAAHPGAPRPRARPYRRQGGGSGCTIRTAVWQPLSPAGSTAPWAAMATADWSMTAVRCGARVTSRSLWSALLGRGVAGRDSGWRRPRVSAVETPWRQWVEAHPQTRVPAEPGGQGIGYCGDPSAGYRMDATLAHPVQRRDARYHPEAPVIGMERNGGFKVYPFTELHWAGQRRAGCFRRARSADRVR